MKYDKNCLFAIKIPLNSGQLIIEIPNDRILIKSRDYINQNIQIIDTKTTNCILKVDDVYRAKMASPNKLSFPRDLIIV